MFPTHDVAARPAAKDARRARDRVEQAHEGIIDRLAAVLDDRDLEDFERISAKILAAFDEPGDEEP